MSGPIRLVIYGAPRTKKNHGATMIHPSAAWTRWKNRADIQCLEGVTPKAVALWRAKLAPAVPDRPYNCAALFYRDALRGDAVGYMQGVADLLEARHVITNDCQIVQWDGSRLLKDAARPRVELILTPV
jgi:hypothetical protein